MNPPLPKPSQPISDNKGQNVVFDKSNTTPVTGAPRIPLAQQQNTEKPQVSTTSIAPSPSLTPPPTPQAGPPKQTLPPSSLSALSSMSSNKIPNLSNQQNTVVANSPAIPAPAPHTTVLGQPLPQAIRGENAPAGISKPAPGFPSQKTVFQVGSPIPAISVKTSPVPTSTSTGGIKQENPTIGNNGSQSPKIATAQNPIMKFLPYIAGGIILIVLIVFFLSRYLGNDSTSVSNNQTTTTQNTTQTGTPTQAQRTEVPSEQVFLEYWGLWEPTEVMGSVISDFENENPGIKIKYVQQSSIDYRERLQTAMLEGSGPDLFRFHASWVPMLNSSLSPIPTSVVTATDFKNNYYPVVSEQLVSEGQYVGLPLMYDGLVLYYNEDILATASETPPKTWPELRTLAVKLTVPSASGIQRGGLAIGNATNIDHFSDILATLILQNGGNLSDAASVETRDALLFYTNFQIADKVWDETLPNSTVAFARGDVAMMFAPSWRAHEIKALNPDLKFSTSSMPQLSADEKIAWSSYWAEGISSNSDNKDHAAVFLKYLNNKEVLRKLFSDASKVRTFGEIYPHIDMADELAEDKVINSILEDAIYSQSGYMNSFTHDNGINDQTIEYFKVAVDALIDGEDVGDIQASLDLGIKQVLKQYGINTK
jgi:multiple sugar transport system substrate-binding protein